jgi:lipopolysaccharide export system protein LptC
MSSLRQANNVRVAILIAVSAALALGSLWVVEVMQRQSSDMFPPKQRTEPDYYVEKFNFVRMGKTGEAHYNLTGTRMTHNPADDSYFVQSPIMHSYGKNRPPMVSSSNTATITNDSTEVHMHDNVVIDRPASATAQHFQLNTTYLLLLPDEDIMKTPEPVALKLGPSTLNGVGMFANNATGEFRLSSNVKGLYQSAKNAAIN